MTGNPRPDLRRRRANAPPLSLLPRVGQPDGDGGGPWQIACDLAQQGEQPRLRQQPDIARSSLDAADKPSVGIGQQRHGPRRTALDAEKKLFSANHPASIWRGDGLSTFFHRRWREESSGTMPSGV